MKDANLIVDKLSKAQSKFIADEFGLDEQEFRALSDAELDDLYSEIGDIEALETIIADARGSWNLSERGYMAASIVTLMGEILRQPRNDPEAQ